MLEAKVPAVKRRTSCVYADLRELSSENMNLEFSKSTQTYMRMIDGFYFSTRYPGDDSIEIDRDDVEMCNEAAKMCRKEIMEFEKTFK